MKRCDLLIAGAGPAGASLALLAARAGLQVTLVERRPPSRDKLCGDFVSAEGRDVLDRLGLLPTLFDAGAVKVRATLLSNRGGATVSAPLPSLPGIGDWALGISRRCLDRMLIERAVAAGVRLLERTTVTSPDLDGDRVTGLRLRAAGAVDSRAAPAAAVIVAADGRRSALGRALHPRCGDPRRTHPRSWFGLKTHFDLDPVRLDQRVELHLFDGGYGGLVGVEGGRVNLALLVRVEALRRCGGSPDRLLGERLFRNPVLRERLAGASRCGGWHSVGPLRFGVRRPAAGGILFVGDAAGTIDPFSGEGISHALRGAELALPFVLHAARSGGLNSALAAEYDTQWRRAFAPVTRRTRMIGRLLGRSTLGEWGVRVLAARSGNWFPRIVAATRTGR